MNRNSLTSLAVLLLLAPAAFAQSGIVAIHPASNPEGKLLTMEDATVSPDVRPANVYARWIDGETYSAYMDGQWKFFNLSGKEVARKDLKFKPEPTIALTRDAGHRTPSAKGDMAFTRGQSLYIMDTGGKEVTVAESENDQITYGQSVSRNEFGINGGIFWSPSGSRLAFYRKDESKVTDFPLLDITTRTGTLKSIKYPMNGMSSEAVTLGIYDLGTGRTVWADVTDFGDDRYLTNISWSPDDRYVFIQVLDRTQKHCRLNQYRADDGAFVRTILTEDNPRYTEPLDPIRFLKGKYEFIYRTDNRDGFRNLYLCDTLGNVRRLTAVDADVDYVANDGSTVWYTSAEVSPVENHLFKVSLSWKKNQGGVEQARIGKPVRLTKEEGWHDISMNPDCKFYVDSWSSLNVPRVANLMTSDGQKVRNLLTAPDPLADFAQCEVDFGTVKSADGKYDNWYRLFKPLNFDPSKKYPVILYVYGGPHSQMVNDSWLGQVRMWEMYMAQRGYVVYVQDNRGTQNRGAEYEKSIHRQCGQNEMADQMVGIEMLKSLPWVDASRIGVHGWSYGGFMTISLMTNYPETFKVGVAGGPVIDWKWYEIMYGERYMDTMETNAEGFEKTSLINKAKDLKGKLLICQGAVDNTVVWEHSLSFTRECIKNNVQLDYFPYPTAEHNVMGRDRIHLMDKVTAYFEDYL